MLIKQIPRAALFWLFLTQAIVILPHLSHLPEWIVAAWLLVLGWRIQMYRGLWRAPRAVEKVGLIGLCCLGLYSGYGRLFALEPMVALLVVAFVLKLLEVEQRRDLFLVIFIGFFVTAAQFLFSVSIVSTLYALLSLWLLVTALISANQDPLETKNSFMGRAPIKTSAVMLLQSLPVVVLLFVFVPKLGALWSVPSLKNAAKTGVSDSMSPGDFSRLSESNEVAFRVTFTDFTPAQSQLYWRGLVFSAFDGRRWSQSKDFTNSPKDVIWSAESIGHWNLLTHKGAEVRYDIMQEPSQQAWLYALAMPKSWSQDTGLSRDLTMLSSSPLTQRKRYEVVSSLDYDFEPTRLSLWSKSKETLLPNDFNPNTRRKALQWLREEGSGKALMQRLLRFYHDQFTYTLQPPALGKHTVDEFLWKTKRGFCEHFSSSFVAFMRSAGIPARVVVGYQGGEFNAAENYWIVRQKDAHAWVEVWFQDEGWVRVDPTAAVAPERIEKNIESALSRDDASLVGGWGGRAASVAWIKTLQLQWDASNYRWQRWALAFDRESQTNFMERYFGGMQPWRIAVAFIVIAFVVLSPVFIRLLWLQRQAPVSPAIRLLLRVEQKAKRVGIVRQRGETATDFLARLANRQSSQKDQLQAIAHLYNKVMYLEEASSLVALKARVHALKL